MSANKPETAVGSFALIAIAGALLLAAALPAQAQSEANAAEQQGAQLQKSTSPPMTLASMPPAPASPARTSMRQQIKKTLARVSPGRLLLDREFKTAAARFPGFCKEWEHKLQEREINNQQHVAWQFKDGWDTGRYVGYSSVEKCECHQSRDGYSIGKLSYEEFDYYVVGKTEQEAKHASRKVAGTTDTTELFRWDKDAWFY